MKIEWSTCRVRLEYSHNYKIVAEPKVFQFTSMVVGFTPIDPIKDLADFIKGKDNFTGEEINRWLLAACIITPEIVDLGIKQYGKNADDIAKLVKNGGKSGDELISVIFDAKQLQRKFKHAIDFGVTGNYNLEKASQFEQALSKVVKNADEIYKTSYHGDAIIYIKDGVGVIVKSDGTFVSGWKLNAAQLKFHRSQLKIK